MRLKPDLPIRELGTRQLALGLVVGFGLALAFYLGCLLIGHATLEIVRAGPQTEVYRWTQPEEEVLQTIGTDGRPFPDPPEIVGPSEAAMPQWALPFWAGLSAVCGHFITLWMWFSLSPPGVSIRSRRARLRARSAASLSMTWLGLTAMMAIRLWGPWVLLIYGQNILASAFGRLVGEDPFVPIFPFGLVAFVFVLFVVLEPWRMLQLAYRCRWWPAVALATTAAVGVLIWTLGHALVPGRL